MNHDDGWWMMMMMVMIDDDLNLNLIIFICRSSWWSMWQIGWLWCSRMIMIMMG